MLKQIVKNLNLDKDYSERSHTIDVYTRILNGELYDGLNYSFCDEYDSSGAYIPLHKRQPSVRNSICKAVVDESVSLLFGNDHFPTINADDEETTESLNKIIEAIKLRMVMVEAALTGSVGSVALFLRIIDEEAQVEVKGTQYLTPYFDPANPKKLLFIEEKYKVRGADLMKMGFDVENEKTDYWFLRQWDDQEERFFKPFLGNDTPVEDKEKTITHGLGFVPVVWIKNLPKPGYKGSKEIDGGCTFKSAIDISIEIDYLLSQGGRGLKYSSDPLVVFRLKDEYTMANNAIPVMGDNSGQKKLARTASNAFFLGAEDDASLLEINGRAAEAIINHVRYLRELGMEGIHGNRSHADKVSAAQSGSAMEKLNQALIWLADVLRIYYGENGIVPLMKMIIEASQKISIKVNGEKIPPMKSSAITLNWPHWYPPTPEDLKKQADTLKTLKDSGLISQETAVEKIADVYDVMDVQAEISKIDKDQEKLKELEPQVREVIQA